MCNYMTLRVFPIGWIKVIGQRAKLKGTIILEPLEKRKVPTQGGTNLSEEHKKMNLKCQLSERTMQGHQ